MWRSWVVLISVCVSGDVLAQQFEGRAQPADVRQAVEALANDLEGVRLYMGKPPVTLKRFQVDFAAPRHVFYQAQTLFRKLNRLGMEVAGVTRQTPPAAPTDDIVPDDVLRVVTLAQQQLALVRETLGLEGQADPPPRRERTEPRDVFEVIVEVNRQVNLMIDDPFRPADVRSQLLLASVYLGGVLSAENKEPFPKIDFVPNKQPVDVYELLIDCLALNQQVGEQLDMPVLKVDPRRLKRDRSILSDNYDIATMLVSDVAFWTAAIDHDEDAFPPAETLRHIFPSHVFAQAEGIRIQFNAVLEAL